MKKFRYVVLVFLLIMSTLNGVAVPRSSAEGSNAVALEALIKQHGILQLTTQGSGLVYAGAFDFDHDGALELYVLRHDEAAKQYIQSIYEDGKVVSETAYAGMKAGNSLSNSIALVTTAKDAFVRVQTQQTEKPSDSFVTSIYRNKEVFATWNGTAYAPVTTALFTEQTYDLEKLKLAAEEGGSLSEAENELLLQAEIDAQVDAYTHTYNVNEKDVAKEAYEAALNAYEQTTSIQLVEGSAGLNTVADYAVMQSIQETLTLLQAGQVPTIYGDNVYESFSAEEKLSLHEWLNLSQHFEHGYTSSRALTDVELLNYIYAGGGLRQQFSYQSPEKVKGSFPEGTVAVIEAAKIDPFLANYVNEALPSADFEGLNGMGKSSGYYYFPKEQPTVSMIAPYIEAVFELAPDVYYVHFTEYDALSGLKEYGLKIQDVYRNQELLKEYNLPIARTGFAIMKKQQLEGKLSWALLQRGQKNEEVDANIAALLQAKAPDAAQLTFTMDDVNRVTTFEEAEVFLNTLVEGRTLNAADTVVVSDFISLAIERLNEQDVTVEDNALAISNRTFAMQPLKETYAKFDEWLGAQSFTLLKPYQAIVRINLQQVAIEQPIQVTLEQSILQFGHDQKDGERLYVSFDGETRGFYIGFHELEQAFYAVNSFGVTLTYEEDGVTVAYSDRTKKLAEAPVPLKIIAPAEEQVIVYAGDTLINSEVLDGKLVAMQTRLAGKLQFKPYNATTYEFNGLAESTQTALVYAARTGMLSSDDLLLLPDAAFTKEAFARAAVQVTGQLQLNAQTTFRTVDPADASYAYVASAEEAGFIEANADGVYQLDAGVSRATLLAFIGEQLMAQKGYEAPNQLDDVLTFMDRAKIKRSDETGVAVAVQAGVVAAGGIFAPQQIVSRAEAAELLYKAHQLLNEQSFYLLQSDVQLGKLTVPKETSVVFWLSAVVVVLAIILGYLFYIRRKRKQRMRRRTLASSHRRI